MLKSRWQSHSAASSVLRGQNKLWPTAKPGSPRFAAGWCLALLCAVCSAQAAQVVVSGPPGSGAFGTATRVLPNGNIVVTDPEFDSGAVSNVGAVHLFRPNGTLISTLRGSTTEDRVGIDEVVVLPNGNFVVRSSVWDHGAAVNAGAVTFVSGIDGINGEVSAANSLVGSTSDDRVGLFGLTVLTNGNYVVRNRQWDNGSVVNAGAVTFGSGSTGISGVISETNSLVGSATNDWVGFADVTPLSNGNYVVNSRDWDNGTIVDAGAVTFGSGTEGEVGVVSTANSLVGTQDEDNVGRNGVIALTNGNYVVRSGNWDNGNVADAGAVTFGPGNTGISGEVSPTNSLVGGSSGDSVGNHSVRVLTNGNYVVSAPIWTNGDGIRVGAVTFGSGNGGITGVISPTNSLVGSTLNDGVGDSGVTPLSNGNYVVSSENWDHGATINVGAVTFGSGISGIAGEVSPTNSLVGTTANDRIGSADVKALTSGNYVVSSPLWDYGGVANAGAVTFSRGDNGIVGAVSLANSLVGSRSNDQVGNATTTALTNGNYVVRSLNWDNDAVVDAGAVTFGSGVNGISGPVSSSNSLVGSSTNDQVGNHVVRALNNGNYVVSSLSWNNGMIADVGAVTFGSGITGVSGPVSVANSLVGSSTGDFIGNSWVTSLRNGNYLVVSESWDNDGTVDTGAATLGSGTTGITGFVSPANSLIGNNAGDRLGATLAVALANGHFLLHSEFRDSGAVADAGAVSFGRADGSVIGEVSEQNSVLGLESNGGASQVFGYDAERNQLVVGQPAGNRMVLYRSGLATSISLTDETPDPSFSFEPVTLSATVSASPIAPTDGSVRFITSTGEQCIDKTPAPITADTAEYSCVIPFAKGGGSTIVAEFVGSLDFAYSSTEPEPHTTISSLLFADGFDGP